MRLRSGNPVLTAGVQPTHTVMNPEIVSHDSYHIEYKLGIPHTTRYSFITGNTIIEEYHEGSG